MRRTVNGNFQDLWDPWDAPEPHGDTNLWQYFRSLRRHSYNRQNYGRHVIHQLTLDCDHCALTDIAAARRHHLRTLYRRRNR